MFENLWNVSVIVINSIVLMLEGITVWESSWFEMCVYSLPYLSLIIYESMSSSNIIIYSFMSYYQYTCDCLEK